MEKKKVFAEKYIQECEKSSEFNNELGGHLLRLRKEKGLSLEELNGITGVSASYLHRIEKGNKIPSKEVLLKIEEAYEIVQGGIFDKAVRLWNARNHKRTEGVENPCFPLGNVTYTYQDYLHWKGRWELIEGVPYQIESPSMLHQRVVSRICIALGVHFGTSYSDEGDEVFAGPFEVRLSQSGNFDHTDTVVQPDIAVVSRKEMLDEKGLKGAPDLVVKVLSPSTSKNDRTIKYDLYKKSGVKEYWIVDPIHRTIELYFEGKYTVNENYIIHEGVLHSAYLKGLRIPVGRLFE